MKIKVDTHTHTLASGHAYSTIREMAEMAKAHGMEAIVFTEHAPDMPGTCDKLYFQNLKILPRERFGIHTFYGVELNILNSAGKVDLPKNTLRMMDWTIASLHTICFQEERNIENVTDAVINAMKNPLINVIGHPDDSRFPLDYESVVKTAKETGTLLEVNNSSLRPENTREGAVDNLKNMLELCKQYEVPVVVGSDSHLDLDAGKFALAEEILEKNDFPEELVVNTSLEKLKTYMNWYKNTRL